MKSLSIKLGLLFLGIWLFVIGCSKNIQKNDMTRPDFYERRGVYCGITPCEGAR